MFAFEVELRGLVELEKLAVDAGADEALGVEFAEQAVVFPLAFGDHRGQQHQFLARGQGQYLVHHLTHGLGLEGFAVLGAVGATDPGEEQAQVVVDLGDGADGGAGVVGGGLLLDGDGRRQPLDVVQVRFVHHRQELPGVGGEGFHVAALSFRIDGVEGERGFAGPGQPGEYDQPIPRQVQVQVFKVVGAGAANADRVHVRCDAR